MLVRALRVALGLAASASLARGGDTRTDAPAAPLAPAASRQRRLLARAGLGVLGALLILIVGAFTPAPALAAPKTWTGQGPTLAWTDAQNWDALPVAGDDLIFPDIVIGHHSTNNNFPTGTLFRSIRIEEGGYTLDGNAVTIFGGQHITANHSNGTTVTINLPVVGNGLAINVTNAGATLVFGGNLTNAGTFQKGGAGTAVLLGTSNSSWNIVAGILNIQNGGAIGNGATIQLGSVLQLQGGITVPGSIGVNGGTNAVQSVSGNNTLTGGIEFFQDTTVRVDAGSTLTISTGNVTFVNSNRTVTVDAGGAVTISSVVTNGPGWGLTKTGVDTLTLSANNTYTGPTTVSAGTLVVNGSQPGSPVTVNAGATLSGTGTTGPLTANGIVSPGGSGPGVLHAGNTVLNLGSTFTVNLNGTTVGSGYDQLAVTGTATLAGPTLAVSVGFPSATGNVFTIVQSTSTLGGSFAGLPDGATVPSGGRTFRINYTPNAVTLTDVTPGGAATPTVTPTPTATPTCILGDINCDGIVDIRDYGVWRQNFGQQGAGNPADLNQDGIVDIRDYGVWRTNFGHTAGAAARTPTPGAAPRLGVATPTPTPLTGRTPASGARGSAWGDILMAAHALASTIANAILLHATGRVP